jgi:hypothetical protein
MMNAWGVSCAEVLLLTHVQCPANHCWQTVVTNLGQYHHCRASVQLVEPQVERKRNLRQLLRGPRTSSQKQSLSHLVTHPGPRLHVPAWWVSSICGKIIYTYLTYSLHEFGRSSACFDSVYLVILSFLWHKNYCVVYTGWISSCLTVRQWLARPWPTTYLQH